MDFLALGSTPLVGSSRTTARDPPTNASATHRRRCMPPDSSDTMTSRTCHRSTSSRRLKTRKCCWFLLLRTEYFKTFVFLLYSWISFLLYILYSRRKKRNGLFNDVLNTFYLQLYGIKIWYRTTQIVREETRCHHYTNYSF